MADNTKLLLLGAAGAAVWWFYIRKPAAADTTAGAAAKPATPSVPVPKVSDIQAAVMLTAKPPSQGLTVDEWGWYVNQALAPYGKTAPDPMPLFANVFDEVNRTMEAVSATTHVPYTPQTFSRATVIDAAHYWAAMEPALKAQGLAGLGIYTGLGALVGRYAN